MLLNVSLLLCQTHPGVEGSHHELKTLFDQGCRAQSPALSKHHYLVKLSFSVPLGVLGQGGVGPDSKPRHQADLQAKSCPPLKSHVLYVLIW